MTRSRTHANRGAAWEAQLALIHARYTSTGYALVGKLPAPFKVLHPQHSGRMVGFWEARGLPDYLICSRGWTLLAEAKSSREPRRWPYKELHRHQAEAMDALCLQGPRMAGLLLLHSDTAHTAYALAWADIRAAWWAWSSTPSGRSAPGTASISWEEVARIALWSAPSLLGGADYLPAVLEALESRRGT